MQFQSLLFSSTEEDSFESGQESTAIDSSPALPSSSNLLMITLDFNSVLEDFVNEFEVSFAKSKKVRNYNVFLNDSLVI